MPITITEVAATRPGALPGFQFRCTEGGCPEVARFTDQLLAQVHGEGHQQWHARRR